MLLMMIEIKYFHLTQKIIGFFINLNLICINYPVFIVIFEFTKRTKILIFKLTRFLLYVRFIKKV